MIGSGKFKQYLTIPEAALVWEGAPLDLLVGAAFAAPGIPVIVGHPDVTARAEALIEATSQGALVECGRSDPDMILPPPEKRIVARKALMDWIHEYWPDEMPGSRKASISSTHDDELTSPGKFLTTKLVYERLGISRATLNRRINAGEFPKHTLKNPNRWPESLVDSYINQPTNKHEDI